MKNKKINTKLVTIIAIIIGMFLSSNLFSQETEEDPLYNGAIKADTVAVKKALAEGADINRQSDNGYTALMWACCWASRPGYFDVAKYLIKAGADVNISANDGSTALLEAAENSEEITRLLLDKGADINARRNDGRGIFNSTTFGILMGKVDLDFAEFILTKGADVNEAATSGDIAGWAAIHYAASNGKEELIKFLIKKGADVNVKTADGKTPLSLAGSSNPGITEILKAAGAK